ncbi:MAG: flagellar biosynthesis protein FlgB [Clostridia bacterium]|nr:flagellar biosynthesis protein FlgB [Clostridia bacterium]
MDLSGVVGTPDVKALGAGLSALAVVERALATNLANAETPGYRAQVVDFQEAFARALAGGDPAAAARTSPVAYAQNGNGVDLDEQMVKLTEMGLQYQAASRMLALAFGRLHTAITGRSS